MTSKIFTAIKQFFNKDTRMENENGNDTRTDETADDARDSAEIAANYSATSATLNAVYNANGTISYNSPNGTISYYNPNGTVHTITSSGSGYASTSSGTYTVNATTSGIGASGGGSGFYNYTNYNPTKVSIDYSSGTIAAKDLVLDGANISTLLNTICDRLAIIEHADPEQLAKYKSLNEAYQKYKFLEKLLVDKDDKPK